MEKNNHNSRYTRLVTGVFKPFWSLFSVKKPTSVPISEIPAPKPEDCVSKVYIDVQNAENDQKEANLDNIDTFDMKYAISVLKEYTNALKETTHELKRLKKAQKEVKSHTKERLEAVRAQNKANLGKKGKNVASNSSKEAKSTSNEGENAPNPPEKG